MTDTGAAPGTARARGHDTPTATGWVGWVVFAAVIMMMAGGFHALMGLVALFRDDYYVTTSSGLALTLDYTPWGWTHLLLGVLVFVAGGALLVGQTWARVVAVGLAVVSAAANMVFVAAYQWWSITVIVLDVLVIYALVVHGREMRSLT
jgi:hypothetical protein